MIGQIRGERSAGQLSYLAPSKLRHGRAVMTSPGRRDGRRSTFIPTVISVTQSPVECTAVSHTHARTRTHTPLSLLEAPPLLLSGTTGLVVFVRTTHYTTLSLNQTNQLPASVSGNPDGITLVCSAIDVKKKKNPVLLTLRSTQKCAQHPEGLWEIWAADR